MSTARAKKWDRKTVPLLLTTTSKRARFGTVFRSHFFLQFGGGRVNFRGEARGGRDGTHRRKGAVRAQACQHGPTLKHKGRSGRRKAHTGRRRAARTCRLWLPNTPPLRKLPVCAVHPVTAQQGAVCTWCFVRQSVPPWDLITVSSPRTVALEVG